MRLKFVVLYAATLLPILLVGVFLLWIGESIGGVVSAGVYLMGIYAISRLLVRRRIIITEEGVIHKTVSNETLMRWDEIKSIGVPRRSPVSGYQKWIYFSKNEIRLNNVEGIEVSDSFFVVSYRERILDEVRKYWDSEIIGV